MMASDVRHAAGCLFGLAIGDALAAPTEFLKLHEIIERFGVEGPLRPSAKVTDDTQMTLAVGEVMLAATRPLTAESLEQPFRDAFVRWFSSPENDRAAGVACMRACELLSDGRDWAEATGVNSKESCANVRATPIGLLPGGKDGISLQLRSAVAQFQAALTHAHPTALAAADLTAIAIWDLSNGGDPAGLTTRLREHAETHRTQYHLDWLGEIWNRPQFDSPEQFIAKGWDECLASLDRLDAALANLDPEGDPCAATGDGWNSEESLATGLLCFLMFPGDPVKAIRRGAVTRGDSDSISALAGAFAGAHLGMSAWPIEWAASIEYRPRIERLARAWDRGR